MAIICWGRRSHTKSLVAAGFLPRVEAGILCATVVSRVLVCAGWRPAFITSPAAAPTTTTTTTVVAIVGAGVVALAGDRRRGLVVVWARGACAWRARGCDLALVGHHSSGLVSRQHVYCPIAIQVRTCSGSACAGSLSGLNPLLYAMMDVVVKLRCSKQTAWLSSWLYVRGTV